MKVLTKGLDVANQALDFFEANQTTNFSYEIEKEAHQHLRDLITNSTSSLKEAISIETDKIIDKIEQDKLEELISRINNIDLLLRIKRHEQLLAYVLQLRESVDYANNRLLEGKTHWLIPYMVGLAMVCATFSSLGEQDTSTFKELGNLVSDTKRMMLSEVSKALFNQGQELPWDLVKNVLNDDVGAIEKYIALLPPTAKKGSGSAAKKGSGSAAKKRSGSPWCNNCDTFLGEGNCLGCKKLRF